MRPFCMRSLARYLLQNRMRLPLADWTVQGFGFMRLRVSDSVRLHIWDSSLRVQGVSDIHDHAQWAFTSAILSGRIENIRYTIGGGVPHHMAVINCGIGGGMMPETVEAVDLTMGAPEIYCPGDFYHQEPDEIHRTVAADGSVTLLHQQRRDTDTARVFWRKGGEWGDAIPRQATAFEVERVGAYALLILAG